MAMDNYRYCTIAAPVRAQFTVSGSRFIGTMAPAESEAVARALLERLVREFEGATHHAYALRIGAGPGMIERANDDREPAGTAGPPMLQVLQGAGLSDIIVVGTRYFGGVKLGIGGLTRAYRDCAKLCLEQAVLVEKEQQARYRIELSYEDLGAAMRHIESTGGEIIGVEYGAAVELTVAIGARLAEELTRGLDSLSRGRCRYSRISEVGGR
ncbi:MAG: YigZ family protein [Firmicutes bacterium]|jgi:uncharacterized YigZ family protein|nr:YigZ family protein [Bacillota bacterium]